MATAKRGAPAPPKEYRFNPADQKKLEHKYWRAPRRLVIGGMDEEGRELPGVWARLWRAEGTTRGGGSATSLLPVLAIHSWPGKPNLDGGPGHGSPPEPGWTGWTLLGRRRMARLAGLNKDTIRGALAQLADAGLLQTRRRPRARHEGGYNTSFRLALEVFPDPEKDEQFATIPAELFYGGGWSFLPTNAARHLYTVIACLDPIANEDEYVEKIIADHHGSEPWWDDEELVERYDRYEEFSATNGYPEGTIGELLRRDYLGKVKRKARSLSELQRLTGLTRATLVEARDILTAPMFGGGERNGVRRPPIALVARGETEGRVPTWYAVDWRARKWGWWGEDGVAFLNAPAAVEQRRRAVWPSLSTRGRGKQFPAELADPSRPSTPWREALRLGEEFRQLSAQKPEMTRSEFARHRKMNAGGVSMLLQIAEGITPEVIASAGLRSPDLDVLSKNALYEVVKGAWRGSDKVQGRASRLARAVAAARRRVVVQ